MADWKIAFGSGRKSKDPYQQMKLRKLPFNKQTTIEAMIIKIMEFDKKYIIFYNIIYIYKMETISNSIEDGLINGLSYKLDATASYITDRKSCTFYAMEGNAYSSNSGS